MLIPSTPDTMQTMHYAGYMKPNMTPLTLQSHFVPQLYYKTARDMSSLKTSSFSLFWLFRHFPYIQKMTSIWMAHLLLPWVRLCTFIILSRIPAKHEFSCKTNSFCNCMFVPKRGWNSSYMYIIIDYHRLLEKYSYTMGQLTTDIIMYCSYM